jgi:hypothetical protein
MGTSWGMSGYGYILQGSNTCGIENSPAFVTADPTILSKNSLIMTLG